MPTVSAFGCCIGTSAYVGHNTFLGSCHDLNIGDNVMIGVNSCLITVNHRSDRTDILYSKQGYTGAPVSIGEYAWLGAHVVVLPGVSIDKDAIIGAGAVVTKDVPTRKT
jgi:acetyltransferase-like isoleucine patch superfamily enzyme